MTKNGIKLLLVEDDKNFGDVLKSYLEMHDYVVELAENGELGLEAFKKGRFDLAIFDVMMPKMDGFTLGREVRALNQEIPIIYLTAKTMKEDIVEGFKIGADDYMTKPFNSEELLLRIQAILKRSRQDQRISDDKKEFEIGKYHFNFPLRILTFAKEGEDEEKIKLSPKEAALLKMFALHLNNVLERSEALTEIWGDDNYFTARSMDVFITKLRKYLRRDPRIEIVNIHGNGFQLLVHE
jgi:two-component system OmpR family response regulator